MELMTNDRKTTKNITALKAAQQFVRAVQKSCVRLQAAYLYGSQAMGNARPDSDTDIAIVSPDLSGDWLDDYCHLTRIADDVDARMEVIPFLPQDFHDENPLVWEIKTTGIPLLKAKPRRLHVKRKDTRA